MEARRARSVLSLAIGVFIAQTSLTLAQHGFVAHSQNFIVFAASPQWANQVSETAEKLRRELAIHWLGEELPPWSQRCPIHVTAGPRLGAGGETRFSLLSRSVGNWHMAVQGTPERILDSVLPHEISHTIFATYFAPLGKYVPRWADEGACTTVEHESEKRKHRSHLVRFLKTGHGLAFNRMFRLKEYPDPILPLYAQGHSVVQFLIDQGGPRKFIQFIRTGMQTEAWDRALQEYYAYQSIGEFQTLWNNWLLAGSPQDLKAYAPGLRTSPATTLATNRSSSDTQQSTDRQGPIRFVGGASTSPAVTFANQSHLSQVAQQRPGEHQSTDLKRMGNESWYKRRLQQTNRGRLDGTEVSKATNLAVQSDVASPLASDSDPASLASRPALSKPDTNRSTSATPASSPGDPYPANPSPANQRSVNTVSRPRDSNTPQVQVLDWGASVPIPGIELNPARSSRSVGEYGKDALVEASATPVVSDKVKPAQQRPDASTDSTTSTSRLAENGGSPVQMVPVRR